MWPRQLLWALHWGFPGHTKGSWVQPCRGPGRHLYLQDGDSDPYRLLTGQEQPGTRTCCVAQTCTSRPALNSSDRPDSWAPSLHTQPGPILWVPTQGCCV